MSWMRIVAGTGYFLHVGIKIIFYDVCRCAGQTFERRMRERSAWNRNHAVGPLIAERCFGCLSNALTGRCCIDHCRSIGRIHRARYFA